MAGAPSEARRDSSKRRLDLRGIAPRAWPCAAGWLGVASGLDADAELVDPGEDEPQLGEADNEREDDPGLGCRSERTRASPSVGAGPVISALVAVGLLQKTVA